MAGPAGRGSSQRVAEGLGELRRRSRATLRDRVARVRSNLGLALQAGVAAAIAWFVARDLIGNPAPFFAPIAACITLAVSVGQRLRRTFELVVGVALGIAVGDALILVIGSGPWQIGLVVTLAIVAALLLGGGSALVVQSASSAVLVATLTPPSSSASYGRFVDALVGGLVGLGVMAVLLPLNPLTVVQRAAGPALDMLAGGLRDVGAALAQGDPQRAEAVLQRLRAAEGEFRAFEEAAVAARENAALAPVRWRTRGALVQYVDVAEHLAYALRNTRVLIRRVTTVLAEGESTPRALATAIRLLGDAVELLRRELAEGVEPDAARERALRAAAEAQRAYEEGVGFSGSVIVAQVRSAAIDVLRASGVERGEATRLARRAIGRSTRIRSPRPATGDGRDGAGPGGRDVVEPDGRDGVEPGGRDGAGSAGRTHRGTPERTDRVRRRADRTRSPHLS